MSKVLITYASKTGTTEEVSHKINEILKEKGHFADLKKINEVKNVSEYDAVILGSGVRVGKIFSESVNFLKRFQNELKNKKIFYFIVCLTIKDDTPENRKIVEGFIKPLIQIIKPIDYQFFAGRFYYSNISPLFRSFLKKANIPEGDYIEWEKITNWVNSISNQI